MMFSGALDLIQKFGWPWHGQIVDDVLTLPSGREMECRVGGWDTQLWDIGMPDSGIVPDDPDEAWWPRSILRGNAGAGSVIYSGITEQPGGLTLIYSAPLRIGGVLYRNYGFAASLTAGRDIEIRISIGFGALFGTVTRASMGVPGSNVGQGVTVIDEDLSRARWLIRYEGFSNLAWAIVLVEVRSSGGGFSLHSEVLASYSDCALWAAEVDEPFNIPTSQRVGWIDGVMTTEAAWPPGRPKPLAFLCIGEHTAHARGSAVAGAWFDNSGDVQLVRRWVDAQTYYSCIGPTEAARTIVTRETLSHWLEAGGLSTAAIEFKRVRTDSTTTTPSFGRNQHDQLTVMGATVYDQTSFFGGSQPGAQIFYYDYHAVAGAQGAPVDSAISMDGIGATWAAFAAAQYAFAAPSSLSNKLVQPSLVATLPAGDSTWLGDALHPTGIAPGLVTHAAADGPMATYFRRGTYNPVTGQVVRNPTDGKRYSWV